MGDGSLMQGGTLQQSISGRPGVRGQSLRACRGTTVAEQAVLGLVVHWLDVLAVTWLVLGRQQELADRLCGIPKSHALEEANIIEARWDLDEHAR